MSQTCRLAAILAADVATGADGEGTRERLKAHLSELVNPKIQEHRGRTLKNTGDGLLAEFGSVVVAVRCAVEVQRGMVDCEQGVPDEQRIRFRISINLGDVIAEDEDIFGDGVHIAARLEALRPAASASAAWCATRGATKLSSALRNLGEQQVKNIARPVLQIGSLPDPATPDRRSVGASEVQFHVSKQRS
jgi:adenylate cyclase